MADRRPARKRGATRLVYRVTFAIVALAIPLRATVACAEPLSIDGLPPGVPLPSWATGSRIHFDPELANDPSSSSVTGSEGKVPSPPAERLQYFDALVQTTPRVALIFWGKNWESEPGYALRKQLETLFSTTPGSGYQKLLSQYSDTLGPISAEGPEIYLDEHDNRVAAPSNVSQAAIAKEAEEYGGGVGLLPVTYMVLPAPGSTYKTNFGEDFCAYHEGFGFVGYDEALAFVPYEGDRPFDEGSCPNYAPEGAEPKDNYDIATSKAASHEYAESITDPEPDDGWVTEPSESGLEVADLCHSRGAQQRSNGVWVSELWDDTKNECEVEDASPGIAEAGPYTDSSLETVENVAPNPERAVSA